MPSDKAWRVPVWAYFILIAAAVATLWFCVVMLRQRVKHNWPW